MEKKLDSATLRFEDDKLAQTYKTYASDPKVKLVIFDLDEQTNQVRGFFPVYRTDNVSDVISKWIDNFKQDSGSFLSDMIMIRDGLNKESGMSKEGNLRLSSRLPETLYWALKKSFPDQDFDTPKGLMKLQEYIPKCFIGRMA